MSSIKTIRIALAGNPNCGKTTIFNNITGAKQHVGNYPGVTVEKKEGHCNYKGEDLLFVDLPGTYSLTARSLDEVVARNVIINDKPDLIVNVLDASNLERNLYLAAQLAELGRPVVIALNMMDIADRMNIKINLEKLGEQMGAVVVPLVGSKNVGTDRLLAVVVDDEKLAKLKNPEINYGEIVEPAIADLTNVMKEAGTISYPLRWAAVKLLENDDDVVAKVKAIAGTEKILAKAQELRDSLKDKVDLEFHFAQYRHQFAVKAYNASVVAAGTSDNLSDKIDRVLTNNISACRFSSSSCGSCSPSSSTSAHIRRIGWKRASGYSAIGSARLLTTSSSAHLSSTAQSAASAPFSVSCRLSYFCISSSVLLKTPVTWPVRRS